MDFTPIVSFFPFFFSIYACTHSLSRCFFLLQGSFAGSVESGSSQGSSRYSHGSSRRSFRSGRSSNRAQQRAHQAALGMGMTDNGLGLIVRAVGSALVTWSLKHFESPLLRGGPSRDGSTVRYEVASSLSWISRRKKKTGIANPSVMKSICMLVQCVFCTSLLGCVGGESVTKLVRTLVFYSTWKIITPQVHESASAFDLPGASGVPGEKFDPAKPPNQQSSRSSALNSSRRSSGRSSFHSQSSSRSHSRGSYTPLSQGSSAQTSRSHSRCVL